jgi:RHS repeat-associated protein
MACFYLDGLLRSTGDGASTTRYGYDGAGQVSVREHGADGGTPERTTFGYNDAGARTRTASSATVPAGQAWTAGYDPAGRLVREQAPNGQVTTHRYHRDDTLHVKRTVADDSAGAELVAQWSYRYDNLFRQLSQTHDGQVVDADADSDHRYGYDPAGRVVEFFDGPGATRQHTAAFDANGNRTSYTTAGVGTQTTRYAADNSLASTTDLDGANPRSSSYTAFGALAGDGCYSYGYDGFDRLTTTAGDPNVLRCATAPTTRYAYDGLDRQRQRTETSVTAPAVTTALHYDGLSTAVASEAVGGLAGTTRGFTLTPGGAAVSVTSSGGALTSPTSSYLLDDGTGTITTITGDQPSSTASGFTTCTARFDPWGTPTTGTGATSTETGTPGVRSANPCGSTLTGPADGGNDRFYRGERRDTATGNYQLGSRTYDPSRTGFLTPDSHRDRHPIADLALGTDPLTHNRYTYVNGDPVNLVDPTGHEPYPHHRRDYSYRDEIKPESGPRSADGAENRARAQRSRAAQQSGGHHISRQFAEERRQQAIVFFDKNHPQHYEAVFNIGDPCETHFGSGSMACGFALEVLNNGGSAEAAIAKYQDLFADYKLVTDTLNGALIELATVGVAARLPGARAASSAAADAAVPTFRSNSLAAEAADDLAAAATRASGAIGPGSGAVHGTRVHSAFAAELQALGRSDVFSEVSYLQGRVVPYGTRGSVRLDAVVGSPGAPSAIYDLKTGSAMLSSSRIAQIRSHLPPGFQDIPVQMLRP